MRGSSTRKAQFRDSSSYWKWTGTRARALTSLMLQQPLEFLESQSEVLRDHSQVLLAKVTIVVEGIDRGLVLAELKRDVRAALANPSEALFQRPPDLSSTRHAGQGCRSRAGVRRRRRGGAHLPERSRASAGLDRGEPA